MTDRKHVFNSRYPAVTIPEVSIHDYLFNSLNDANHGHGDKKAFIDSNNGSNSLTFKQFKGVCDKIAQGLQAQGLQQKEVALIYTPNTIYFPCIAIGVLNAGGIFSPANPTYTVEELTHQIKDSTAKFVFTIADFAEKAIAACKAAKIDLSRLIVIGNPVPGTLSFNDLIKNAGTSFKKYKVDPHDIALIPYSSGTTGLPKGVMLTHHNIVSNMLQIMVLVGTAVKPDDVILGLLPFFHIYGFTVVLLVGMALGATTVVMPQFVLDKFLQLVQDLKISVLFLVPPIVLALAKHPLVAKFDISSVRTITSGAAPLGPETTKAVMQRLPHVAVLQGWGMTELSPVGTFQHPTDVVPGSIGPLGPNQQAMIVDPDTMKSLPQGGVGELWIRGPNVMKGYWRRPEATAATIVEGDWLRTGDISTLTPDGHYWVVDRLKELIKYKGFQVAPAELEELLLTHPEITDAAVLGVPEEGAGELPKAYVALKPGSKLTAEAVQQFVASKLAPHKQLRGGVVFTEAIPKSASGKILRRILKVEDEKTRKAAKAKL